MAGPSRFFMTALFVIAAAILPMRAAVAQSQKADPAPGMPAGQRLFLSTGCGACHRIAGTDAQGKIGPDLTHIGSRATLGANLVPMTPENLSDWIRHTQAMKPGARMPSFGMLPRFETDAIVNYLVTLK